jgi:hypothetical protein
MEGFRPFFPPSPLPESPVPPEEALLPRPSAGLPDEALPLEGEDSGLLLLLSTTVSSAFSWTVSVLSFAFSSDVSSTASLEPFVASFRRAGDVENFELPGIACAGRQGRKHGDVLVES